jgi:hypothetical protein
VDVPSVPVNAAAPFEVNVVPSELEETVTVAISQLAVVSIWLKEIVTLLYLLVST